MEDRPLYHYQIQVGNDFQSFPPRGRTKAFRGSAAASDALARRLGVGWPRIQRRRQWLDVNAAPSVSLRRRWMPDAGCRPRRAAEVGRGRDGSPRDGRLLRRKTNDWLRTSLDGAGNQNRGEMSNRSEAHRSDVRPCIRWGRNVVR